MAPRCELCGSKRTTLWLERAPWRYLGCAECSAVWLDPPPVDGWAESFYDAGYFSGGGRGGYRDYLADEAQHRSNAQARIALAQRYGAAPPGTWLDIGCAAGFTLEAARSAGFAALGVDVSEWARRVARERFGLSVFPTLGEARGELAGSVDVASAFQVLEHLGDPLGALRDARACLRPGGLLIIETWDRGSLVARLLGRHWQQITPPSVLWLFDRKSLALALERAGYRVRAVLRTSKRVSVGWVLGVLADRSPRTAGMLMRALARSRVRSLGITYGLGDLVTAVAIHEPFSPANRLRSAAGTDCRS
jgi:SAM-dependent methyltransferase